MTVDVVVEPQRIDKWLWHARFFKTRTLAGKFAAAGGVRLRRGDRSDRVAKSSAAVRTGDILTFCLGDRVRVIEILAIAARRGPAAGAQRLYADHSPPNPPQSSPAAPPAARSRGAGRPTKKERRNLEKLVDR